MSLYDRTVGLVRFIYNRRISTPPVLDASVYFPDAQRFVSNWPAIRVEALRVAEHLAKVPRFHELLPEQAEISAKDDKDWRMFVLKAYGMNITANLAQCPQLAALLAESPDVLSATFSFLAPRKHIPKHCGPFRGVLRFHLGLVVPADSNGQVGTRMTVADGEHRIGDGDALLWDDTYDHEVWNETDELRVALLLDVRRKRMPFDMIVLSCILIAAIRTSIRFRLAPAA